MSEWADILKENNQRNFKCEKNEHKIQYIKFNFRNSLKCSYIKMKLKQLDAKHKNACHKHYTKLLKTLIKTDFNKNSESQIVKRFWQKMT